MSDWFILSPTPTEDLWCEIYSIIYSNTQHYKGDRSMRLCRWGLCVWDRTYSLGTALWIHIHKKKRRLQPCRGATASPMSPVCFRYWPKNMISPLKWSWNNSYSFNLLYDSMGLWPWHGDVYGLDSPTNNLISGRWIQWKVKTDFDSVQYVLWRCQSEMFSFVDVVWSKHSYLIQLCDLAHVCSLV